MDKARKIQPQFYSKTGLDLNPASATYDVIWNKLFSRCFLTCKMGDTTYLNSPPTKFCYLEGLQMKPAS